MPVLSPGIYRASQDQDFVYEVTPDGVLAYPTRAGIGPGAGFTPFSGSTQGTASINDILASGKPVATSYTGQPKTVAQATQEFQAGTGRLPGVAGPETIPTAPGYFGGPRGGGIGGERVPPGQGAQAQAAAQGIQSSTGQPFTRFQIVKNPQGADVTIGYFADGGFELVESKPRYDLAGFPSAPSGASPTSGTTAGGLNISGLTPQQYYSQLETLIGSGIGLSKEQAEEKAAREKLAGEIAGRKTSRDIFEEEAKRLGLDYKTQINLLNELDVRLLAEQQAVRNIPKELKETLETHGVTQRQLDAAIEAKQKPRLEVFRDTLEARNVATSQLQRSLNFVESFTNMRLRDEAMKVEGLKTMFDLEEGDVKKLETKQKEILAFSINERKEVLQIAEDAAKNGATQEQIDSISQQTTKADALKMASQFGVAGAAKPETELDTFTDPSGNRISVLYDPTTRTTRRLNLGKAQPRSSRGIFSQTQVNRLAQAGVPENIALNIQSNLNAGNSLSDVRQGLAQQIGNRDLAFQYVDRFMESVQKNLANDILGLLQEIQGGISNLNQ